MGQLLGYCTMLSFPLLFLKHYLHTLKSYFPKLTGSWKPVVMHQSPLRSTYLAHRPVYSRISTCVLIDGYVNSQKLNMIILLEGAPHFTWYLPTIHLYFLTEDSDTWDARWIWMSNGHNENQQKLCRLSDSGMTVFCPRPGTFRRGRHAKQRLSKTNTVQWRTISVV